MKLKKYYENNSHFIFFSDLSKFKTKNELLNSAKYIEKIIEKLKNENKNIILPTYNLFFPETKITDFTSNHITTGYLNKYLLKKFKFKRTLNPMYNYALLGPDKNNILNCKQSTAWGEDSVIKYLIDKNTIGVGINIDLLKFNWMVIHYLEEKYKVPYRFYKIFKGYNRTIKKRVTEKMYVRRLNSKTSESYKLINIIKKKKLLKKEKIKNNEFSFMSLKSYFELGDKKINKNIMYFKKNEKK